MESTDSSFFVHKMGSEAGPLQFLRELTQNGIEAIAKAGGAGVVSWQPWDYHLGDGRTIRKLSVFDTGCGMTATEMERYLNRLASSGSQAGKSEHGNFGVGAKITALRYNGHGVLYLSLKDGVGSKMRLHRTDAGKYGVLPWPSGRQVDPVDLTEFPAAVRKAGHGTLVVLLGEAGDDATAEKPSGYSGGETAWLPRWLNARYRCFPTGVIVSGYELRTNGQQMGVAVDGAVAFLDTVTHAGGSKRLSDVTVHWRILREDPRRGARSGYTPTSQHVAAIRGDEVYELFRGSAALSRIRRSGIYAGEKNVVLYFEPNPDVYVPNMTRTVLTSGEHAEHGSGAPLPWDRWFDELAGALPGELEEYVHANLTVADSERTAKIEDALRGFLGDLGVSRLKRAANGTLAADPLSAITGGSQASTEAPKGDGGGAPGGEGGTTRREDLLPAAGGDSTPAKAAGALVIPGHDCRPEAELPHLRDRAAEFLSEVDNGRGRLTLNADFRGFTDLTKHIVKASGLDPADPNVTAAATRLVRDHFTRVLLESVLSLRHLRDAGGKQVWSGEVLDKALSPEALTLACLQRQDAAAQLARELKRLPELKVKRR